MDKRYKTKTMKEHLSFPQLGRYMFMYAKKREI